MNYTIDEPTKAIEARIELLEDYLDHKFAEATDAQYGRYLIKQYDRLESAKKLLVALQGTIEEVLLDEHLRSYRESGRGNSTKPRLRTISISVTEGMINQNLLTLTDAKKRGHVEENESFTITPDGGEQFKTSLVNPGNRLQKRGPIAAFYKQHNVEDGDRVVLREVEPSVWTLTVDEECRKVQAAVFEEIMNL